MMVFSAAVEIISATVGAASLEVNTVAAQSAKLSSSPGYVALRCDYNQSRLENTVTNSNGSASSISAAGTRLNAAGTSMRSKDIF